MCFFFFFKQKTAYEMRISDWSSDVCSSDLFEVREDPLPVLLLGGIGRGPGPEHVQRVVVQVHASGESPPVLSPSPLLSSSNLASSASKSSSESDTDSAVSSRKPSGSSRSSALGSRPGCSHTESRPSLPCREGGR